MLWGRHKRTLPRKFCLSREPTSQDKTRLSDKSIGVFQPYTLPPNPLPVIYTKTPIYVALLEWWTKTLPRSLFWEMVISQQWIQSRESVSLEWVRGWVVGQEKSLEVG